MFAYYLSPSTTPSDLQSFCLAFSARARPSDIPPPLYHPPHRRTPPQALISLTTSGFECSPLLAFKHELFIFKHELFIFEHKLFIFEHKYLGRCLLRDTAWCKFILILARHRPSSSNLALALSSPPP
ncbi:hypothetical protein GGG16DRAFT_119912 [Schizophyllum commune]